MPSLSACTNVLWHSKVITKNSLFSIPGPSAYRILCIIPNASRALPVLLTTKLDLAPVADSLEFNDDEIDMLSSVYGVDIQRESKHKSDGLNEALIKSPYWGGCIYFNEKDMLCVVLFGE